MSAEWRGAQRCIALLSGRWTLAILAELRFQGCRYQQLHDALDGISHKVLTDTLRRAERDGFISRRLDERQVETATFYQLTALGRSLEEPLGSLANWVRQNDAAVDESRRRWDERSKRISGSDV